jgi:phosphopantothenoylcysteine decarboxylase/phosphopantothenate--cysteine ligase
MSLRGKHILVGVTGGIAAYKVCYFVRELVRSQADVRVVMTESGQRFVTPLTFSALSKYPVLVDLWTADQSSDSDISTRHINLANWADAFVIAPASANTIAKLTHGISDNLLTIVALACARPIILAPAMDADMYLHEATQKNLAILRQRGMHVMNPESGELASGLSGPGRLPEIEQLKAFVEHIISNAHQDLKKKRILVTAGPTFEPIDPVRYIGNRSSGKMGFAIATAAAQRGADVTLIAGPTHLETPRNVKRVDVETAQQMLNAVEKHGKRQQAIIMAAAVADYAPAHPVSKKIKKTDSSIPELTLKQTPDILAALGANKGKRVLVGFALETDQEEAHAREKLTKKNLDLIVMNSLAAHASLFGSDTNIVTMIDRNGTMEKLPEMPKFDVAHRILDAVGKLLS